MMALQLSEDRISMTSRRNDIIEDLSNLPRSATHTGRQRTYELIPDWRHYEFRYIKETLAIDKELQTLAKEVLFKEKSLLVSFNQKATFKCRQETI